MFEIRGRKVHKTALFAPSNGRDMLKLFPAIKVRFNGKYPNSLLAYYYPYIQADFYSAAAGALLAQKEHTQHCLTFIGLLGEIKLVSLLV